MDKTSIIWFMIFTGFGALILGISLLKERRKNRVYTGKADGTVINIISGKPDVRTGYVKQYLQIQLTANGEKYISEEMLYRAGKDKGIKKGDQVIVHYDPQNPYAMHVEGNEFPYGIYQVCLVACGVLFLFALLFYLI